MYTKILTPHRGSRTAIKQPYQEGIGEQAEDVLVIASKFEHRVNFRLQIRLPLVASGRGM